jgi:uncharacterized membrane protein
VIAAAQLSGEVTATVATAIVAFASMIIFTGSLLSLRSGRHTGRQFATYIGIGLEFFLAAGLIRLASVDTFAMLGIVAAIIAVRRTVVLGLGYAARATG